MTTRERAIEEMKSMTWERRILPTCSSLDKAQRLKLQAATRRKVCFERRKTAMSAAFKTTLAKKYVATIALAYGIVVGVTPALAGITTNVPSVAEWACTPAIPPECLLQIAESGFQNAANIVRKRNPGARVIHIERYRGVYYVTISTSSGHQTHCVKNNTYQGRC